MERAAKARLVRDLRKWDLVALVINSIIGAGIFGLPSRVFALAGTYSLLAYLVAAVPGDRRPRPQVLDHRTFDDDRVVAGDEVADALAVGEPLRLVVHPAGEVVEQAVADLGGSPAMSSSG